MIITENDKKRFWEKVDVSGDDSCWNWNAGIFNTTGYGAFWMRSVRAARAHRISYEIAYGEIPDCLCVCHKCDNRLCVNPKHLFLGTLAENIKDCVSKGRNAKGEKSHMFRNPCYRGENNPKAKLSAQDVSEIKNKLNCGSRQSELAKEYRVTRQTIWGIAHGKLWSIGG